MYQDVVDELIDRFLLHYSISYGAFISLKGAGREAHLLSLPLGMAE